MLNKKRLIKGIMVILVAMLLSACNCSTEQEESETDIPVWLNMNKEFPDTTNLPDGNGQKVKVVLLLGQSNASGCALESYLEKNVSAKEYDRYRQGFPSVLINYCVDDHKRSSNGEFVKVDLTCGAGDGYYGPEVGIAETLSAEYPDETIVILKYTMSGYSLHHHWLSQRERGSIYEAFLIFAEKYMNTLLEKNYDAKIGAICWMQGESDSSEYKASMYYDNQVAFVSYLREDLEKYADDGGIYFIDAGISNSPYCEPGYPTINKAKEAFCKLSEWNLYFSTIDHGLTIHLEPEGEPDWGHYDSMSAIKLGRLFGEQIIESYQMRETTK